MISAPAPASRPSFDTVVFRNRLDDDAKIALYRIAQEALTNIERHSGATQVSIDLRGHKSGATLRISDNGRGIEPTDTPSAPASGLGLRNMQERIEQLDGTLRILSTAVRHDDRGQRAAHPPAAARRMPRRPQNQGQRMTKAYPRRHRRRPPDGRRRHPVDPGKL